MKRVFVYIDGFNFYYGLKEMSKIDKKWKKFYWLDIVSFFERMLSSDQQLIKVYYFSAFSIDIKSVDRQKDLFSANQTNNKFKLILGKYYPKNIICKFCGKTITSFEEKQTDVNIATKMIEDVYENKCDISILVSADSDLGPAIKTIKRIKPDNKVFVFFPPQRHSVNLDNLCHSSKKLHYYKARFNQSMLPDDVTLANGTIISRPDNWT